MHLWPFYIELAHETVDGSTAKLCLITFVSNYIIYTAFWLF